jgi:hypothetical protein
VASRLRIVTAAAFAGLVVAAGVPYLGVVVGVVVYLTLAQMVD